MQPSWTAQSLPPSGLLAELPPTAAVLACVQELAEAAAAAEAAEAAAALEAAAEAQLVESAQVAELDEVDAQLLRSTGLAPPAAPVEVPERQWEQQQQEEVMGEQFVAAVAAGVAAGVAAAGGALAAGVGATSGTAAAELAGIDAAITIEEEDELLLLSPLGSRGPASSAAIEARRREAAAAAPAQQEEQQPAAAGVAHEGITLLPYEEQRPAAGGAMAPFQQLSWVSGLFQARCWAGAQRAQQAGATPGCADCEQALVSRARLATCIARRPPASRGLSLLRNPTSWLAPLCCWPAPGVHAHPLCCALMQGDSGEQAGAAPKRAAARSSSASSQGEGKGLWDLVSTVLLAPAAPLVASLPQKASAVLCEMRAEAGWVVCWAL